MPALSELQLEFVDGILRGRPEILRRIKADGGLAPAQRLQIYRNNTFFILTGILKAAFPATEALGSADFFRHAAREFIISHPPDNGDMNTYGAGFPSFLRRAGLVESHPFLADVAGLEWLRQESYMAADEGSAPLHPSLRMFSSRWPVVSLWKLGKGLASAEEARMDKGENAVVFRRGDGIEMWSVDGAAFSFIRAVAEGGDFEAPEEFDPAPHVGNLREAGLIRGKGGRP